jgi:hypothetical protein
VCATPEVAKRWPTPAVAPPFYVEAVEDGERLGVRLADGRPATLLRFRTSDPLGRVAALVRGKPWRSPAAKLARLLFHLQNAGVDVPPLFAFGQRLDRGFTADSFLVHGLPDGSLSLEAWLAKNAADRDRLLTQLGGVLRTAHDAGCVLGGSPKAVAVIPTRGRPRLVLDPTHGGELRRTVSEPERIRDLRGVLGPLAAHVLDGYAPGPDDDRLRKQVAAA